MKKALVIGGILTASVVGFLLWKKYKKPVVKVMSVDWDKKTANIVANGVPDKLTRDLAIMLGNNYSVEMSDMDITLKKNGSIVETLSTK